MQGRSRAVVASLWMLRTAITVSGHLWGLMSGSHAADCMVAFFCEDLI